MEMSQYMDMFMEESREHLQNLNQTILNLENNPDDRSILDEIFRSAHTLKGMSATMGFNNIAELTHEMENVLHKCRGGEMHVTSAIVDLLFKCIDALENMVNDISDGNEKTFDVSSLVSILRATKEGGAIPTGEVKAVEVAAPTTQPGLSDLDIELNEFDRHTIESAKNKGFNTYHIKIEIKQTCIMKSARAYMIFRNLEDIGEIIKSVPSVQEIEEEKFEWDFQIILISLEGLDEVKAVINTVSEIEEPVINIINHCVNSENPISTLNTNETTPVEVEDKTEQAKASVQPEHKKAKVNQTVRVEIDRLDNLMNLVGELVINKTRIEQISSLHGVSDLVETIEHMDRITTDLQNVVMKVRMVPIEQVFNRFPRMVRDLTKDLGKDIELVIEGKETELDRTVIDEIGDPLVHLIRNSIDHGIEMPDERAAQGKPNPAIVRLAAKHEGNNVVIEVEDDGNGINPETIKRIAVKKGLITQKDADAMDDQTAVYYIFHAGFSTAEVITDVSGRGVGLDAVRSKIESLSGAIQIDTKVGKGTKFKIQLPLTLAIIQALLVKLGDESYAIPLSSIDETTSIKNSQIKKVQDQEVILLRGSVLPLIRMHNVLDVPQQEVTEESELYVVVVRKGDKQAGLIVDALIGQQEIVIKSLGNMLSGITGIAGATILGNGQVSLILDVGSLF